MLCSFYIKIQQKKQQQQEYLWISTDRQRIRSLFFYAEYKKWYEKKVDTVQLKYARVKNKTLRKYV